MSKKEKEKAYIRKQIRYFLYKNDVKVLSIKKNVDTKSKFIKEIAEFIYKKI